MLRTVCGRRHARDFRPALVEFVATESGRTGEDIERAAAERRRVIVPAPGVPAGERDDTRALLARRCPRYVGEAELAVDAPRLREIGGYPGLGQVGEPARDLRDVVAEQGGGGVEVDHGRDAEIHRPSSSCIRSDDPSPGASLLKIHLRTENRHKAGSYDNYTEIK